MFVHEKLETRVTFTCYVQSGCRGWGTIPSSGALFWGSVVLLLPPSYHSCSTWTQLGLYWVRNKSPTEKALDNKLGLILDQYGTDQAA